MGTGMGRRAAAALWLWAAALAGADADLILHNGRILTVDAAFSVAEAVAVKDGRIAAVGKSADVLARERGPRTRLIDLAGRTVLPGLIDAHVHAMSAALSEYREPVPVLRSFDDIRRWVREKAARTPKGQWIRVTKTFPTRLKEMRMPTREVLDAAAEHPVIYDASYSQVVNTYALRLSGITRATPEPPGATIGKDAGGEPNGILTRGAVSLLKGVPRDSFTEPEQLDALERMLRRYAAAGLTTVGDRSVSSAGAALYRKLHAGDRLPVRVMMSYRDPAAESAPERLAAQVASLPHAPGEGDDRLRFGPFKVGLDGGMNAGTAYMREPYGPYQAELFGIRDPANRGELFLTPENLLRVLRAARDKGWPVTAHSQGGGAVDVLLGVFETLDRERPIAASRSHLIHASFLSPESIALCRKLGILVDAQPAWLHFDGAALARVMRSEAMRYFIPLRSLIEAGVKVAGGTDHMVGWDRNTSVNAYNPFLGMYAAVTRRTAQGGVIHPEERIDRRAALRMYTIWPAYLYHADGNRGSLEPGKLADLVVIDRDYLACPEEQIKEILPVMTLVGGRVAWERK